MPHPTQAPLADWTVTPGELRLHSARVRIIPDKGLIGYREYLTQAATEEFLPHYPREIVEAEIAQIIADPATAIEKLESILLCLSGANSQV